MVRLVKQLVKRIDHFVSRYNEDCKPSGHTKREAT